MVVRGKLTLTNYRAVFQAYQGEDFQVRREETIERKWTRMRKTKKRRRKRKRRRRKEGGKEGKEAFIWGTDPYMGGVVCVVWLLKGWKSSG